MVPGNHQQTAEALAADLYTGAKLILLTEDGALAERLVRAYGDMAIHATQLAEQLPRTLGRRIVSIHEALTGGTATGERDQQADLRATIGSMAREDRIRVAMDIADLGDDLDREVRASRSNVDPTG